MEELDLIQVPFSLGTPGEKEGASLRTKSKALMYRWFDQPEWR